MLEELVTLYPFSVVSSNLIEYVNCILDYAYSFTTRFYGVLGGFAFFLPLDFAYSFSDELNNLKN